MKDFLLIAVVAFQILVVGPLLMLFWQHTIALEARTAILCTHGLPGPDYVGRIEINGCKS